MVLTPEETRVLGSLIEKEATVPDSYPLTLNVLRLACNQTSNRHPVVAYDDRTVEQALLSLKSMGLVRFVHPSHGGRTTRYRHAADERWRLSKPELAVLSVLILRGPQTVGEVRGRADRQHAFGDLSEVDEILDTLAGRSPEPFVVRLDRRASERDARWAHVLSGEPDDLAPSPPGPAFDDRRDVAAEPPRASGGGRLDSLESELVALRRRIERLEQLAGMAALDEDDGGGTGATP
ncbi:MAG: YceH family protein [Acidimicrobiales bacterium]